MAVYLRINLFIATSVSIFFFSGIEYSSYGGGLVMGTVFPLLTNDQPYDIFKGILRFIFSGQ